MRPLVRLSVTVIAEQDGRREQSAPAAAAAASAWATSSDAVLAELRRPGGRHGADQPRDAARRRPA
ncbi:MAG: hypothetical protein MZW92_69355 [Comamonadaceae bacterium]|nr:hypothetical protein [Comamonadaceae bacterium]